MSEEGRSGPMIEVLRRAAEEGRRTGRDATARREAERKDSEERRRGDDERWVTGRALHDGGTALHRQRDPRGPTRSCSRPSSQPREPDTGPPPRERNSWRYWRTPPSSDTSWTNERSRT